MRPIKRADLKDIKRVLPLFIALGGLGGAAFGAAPAIAGATGLSGSALGALTGGIRGAGLGGITGGGQGALVGAGLGGLGGFIGGGGSLLGSSSLGSPASQDGVFESTISGTGLGEVGDIGASGSGLGALTTQIGGAAQPMMLGSLLQTGVNLLGYSRSKDSIDDMRRQYELQAQRAEEQYQPFAQAGQQALANLQAPSMEALQADPGYQFRLQQGQNALERSLAARGLGQSGAALKAAQDYGQNLAAQTYDNYFNRQNQIANYGFNSAAGLSNIYAGLGNAQAAAERAEMENRNRLYGGLGGIGNLIGGLF